MNVQKVDSASGQATLTLREELTWTDPRLAWEPADFGGLSSLYLPKEDVWFPDVTFIKNLIEQNSRDTGAPVVNVRHGIT